MSVLEIRDYLSKLTGHVIFDYMGRSCGVDPLALDSFDMWYGNNEMTAKSIDEVMTAKFFNGKSLTDIWCDVTEVDF